MIRKKFINIHLILAALFLPFLLHMPLSGTLYLLGIKGSVEKEFVFSTQENFSKDREGFIQQLKNNGIDFNFEYVKTKGNTYFLRPSTRAHYQVVQNGNEHSFYKMKPDLVYKLIEMHKGHGPKLFKKVETAFGIGFILIVISGLILLFTVTNFLKLSILPFSLGLIIFLLSLIM